MRTVALLTCMMFVWSLVAPVALYAETVTPKIDWGSEFIKVRGLGSFDGEASARKLIIAREKAKMRAERDLLGIIEGVNVDSNTTMKETMDAEEYHEAISTAVKGLLKGAQILAEGQLNKNTYEVIMGVKIAEIRKAALCPKDPNKPASDENPIIIPSRNYLDMQSPGPTKPSYLEPMVPTPEPPVGGETPTAVEPAVVTPTVVTPTVPTPAVPVATGAHGKVTQMVTDDAPAAPAEPVADADLDDRLYAGVAATVGKTPEPAVVEPTPAYVAPTAVNPVTPAAYEAPQPLPAGAITSLVVDGRRLDADRAFWPRLLGPSQEVIYGNYDASIDFLQDQGAVAYAKSIEEARECDRCGANPLIVKATDVFGKYKADLVVDADTAGKIRDLEGKYGFMKGYKVIFILR